MTASTIWRFDLDTIDDTIDVEMRATLVRWLHAEPHGVTGVTLWAEVDPTGISSNGYRVYPVHVRGTGHPLTGDEGTHIGTVVTISGLVWHLFTNTTPYLDPEGS